VQPSEPFGRNAAGIIAALIGHPSAIAAIRLWLTRLKIDIPNSILANAIAVHPGVKPSAEGLAFPPCEDVFEYAHNRADTTFARAMQRRARG